MTRTQRCLLAIVLVLAGASTKTVIAPAAAQVAPPTNAKPVTTPAWKAGWVAQVRSYGNGEIGETSLGSFTVGADKTDAFARIPRTTIRENTAAIVFNGQLNVPEAGKYGFLLNVGPIAQPGGCTYSLHIDTERVFDARATYKTGSSSDKTVELTASSHSVELRVGCASSHLQQIKVELKVQAPNGDEARAPAPDLIIHATRASGD